MAAIIFFIIILFVILPKLRGNNNSHNQKANDADHTAQSRPAQSMPARNHSTPNRSMSQRAAVPNRPAKSSAVPNKPETRSAGPNKPNKNKWEESRKKYSASDDRYQSSYQKKAEVPCDADRIIEAALENARQVELDNDQDAAEDLMAGVYDAMVKGPKDMMSFHRDFIAEGMDMLNNIESVHTQEGA